MKELEAAVLDGRFHHNGDPLLSWMISNIMCAPNRHDDLFPYKQRPERMRAVNEYIRFQEQSYCGQHGRLQMQAYAG